MLPVTRRQKIKEYVQEKKSATVLALAAMYNVTDETIPPDLKALEKEGALMRTYGGAFLQTGVENLVEADLRAGIYVDNKKRIAAICRGLIQNGDALFLDNSTTCFYIAQAVEDMRLTIVTNSLTIMNQLAPKENLRLICTGGVFSHSEKAFYGATTVNTLLEYYVDKAFISCRSLSIEHGITDSMERWNRVRQAAVERSKETYLVADFSKFNETSFMRLCGFDSVAAIITDKPLGEEWHTAMSRWNCKIFDRPVD